MSIKLKNGNLIITTSKPKIKLYRLTSGQATWLARSVCLIFLVAALFANNVLLVSVMIFITILSMLVTINITPIEKDGGI